MTWETAFKGLCMHASKGTPIRALFITPTAVERNRQQIAMINEAGNYGLATVWYKLDRNLAIGPASAYLRIAHPYIDREMKAYEWHFIHGLEYVEALEDGDAIAANLQMRVRS